MIIDYQAIAGRIDHALLLPQLTDAEVEAGCQLAREYRVATVCVRPSDIARAVGHLAGSSVGVGTVIGFPHGATLASVKALESERCLELGTVELDMVVNIGAVRSGRWAEVADEIGQIRAITRGANALLKVIFENCYLSDSEKVQLCTICNEVGVDYVKTSTGFGSSGAVESDLILMRQAAQPHVKLKAAGGMRDLATAIRFVELGCDRLGTSQTRIILDGFRTEKPSEVSRGTSGPGSDY